ncbi:MAG: SiaB family protein kinase [Bacteroidetes bacterium]|nr:SiaB family protein kinase [Bacteroidota bacterium]
MRTAPTMSYANVIYDYQGEMDNSVLNKILVSMDTKMAELGEKVPFRKKVNSILIECCQNLMHHAMNPEIHPPSLQVLKQDNGYLIRTTNLVNKTNATKLKSYIDKINTMDKDELREFYQKILTNGKISAAGGGGLGILNIARKTIDNRVNYQAEEVNTDQLLFHIQFVV